MKITYDSQQESVAITVPDNNPVYIADSNTITNASPLNQTTLTVSIQSDQRNLSVWFKPYVLVKQNRQERLSRSIRLGFQPISKSTKR